MRQADEKPLLLNLKKDIIMKFFFRNKACKGVKLTARGPDQARERI